MKCKFYSEEIGKCLFDGPPDDCPFENNEESCVCFEPKMIECGSSDTYEDEDEFSKKYCRGCSSLVCGGVRDTVAREGCRYYRQEMKKEKQIPKDDVVVEAPSNKPSIKLELIQYPYSKAGPTVYLDGWQIAGPRAFGVGKTVASYELTEADLKYMQKIATRELNRLNGEK